MDKLKVYLWDFGELTTCAMAFAVAHNKEEALKLIEERYGKLTDKQKEIKPQIISAPRSFVYFCD